MGGELLWSDIVIGGVVIGVGATAVMDLWALILKHFFGIEPLNYALVGRWLAHILRGTFRHENIRMAKPVAAELLVGWAAHYVVGVVFAASLIMLAGNDWLSDPGIIPAIGFGVLTVGFPFLLMQPGMGFGIAAEKSPKPNVARLRSLLAHFTFGLGLYFSATLRVFLIG